MLILGNVKQYHKANTGRQAQTAEWILADLLNNLIVYLII